MPAPLEIVEFTNALAIGGTERQFVNLARGLDPAVREDLPAGIRQSMLAVSTGLGLLVAACGVSAELAPDESGSSDDPEEAVDAGPQLPPLEDEPATAELLLSLTSGEVMRWRPDGVGAHPLQGTLRGPAFGMAFDASSNIYVTHGYTEDLKGGNGIEVFDPEGNRIGELGTAYDCNPHSIVFDDMQRAYVGQSDCGADLLQLDSSGELLLAFDVVTEERGSDWIALADDQCTILYTSQGPDVKRYDVCTKMQLDDFNLAPLPVDVSQGSGAQELKVLPDGSVLVANYTEVVLLDAAGAQSRVYDMPGPDGWRGLDLDADGTSFWVANYTTSDIVRFDLASGDAVERLNSGSPPFTVKSVLARLPSAPTP